MVLACLPGTDCGLVAWAMATLINEGKFRGRFVEVFGSGRELPSQPRFTHQRKKDDVAPKQRILITVCQAKRVIIIIFF